MQIMIQRIKMLGMDGRAYAYDVWVPVESLAPEVREHQRHFTVIDGIDYVDFTQATLPVSHYKMPTGWDRYEVFLAHEKRARVRAWALVREHFPETRFFDSDTLPQLWINYGSAQGFESAKIEAAA